MVATTQLAPNLWLPVRLAHFVLNAQELGNISDLARLVLAPMLAPVRLAPLTSAPLRSLACGVGGSPPVSPLGRRGEGEKDLEKSFGHPPPQNPVTFASQLRGSLGGE